MMGGPQSTGSEETTTRSSSYRRRKPVSELNALARRKYLKLLGAGGALFVGGVPVSAQESSSSSAVEIEWERTYGGDERDATGAVIETSDGGYLLAGATRSFAEGELDAWLIKTDSEGHEVWNQTYGGADYDSANSVIETNDGGYLFAGYTQSFTDSRMDAWIVKLNSTGSVEWSRTYGGNELDNARAVVSTNDGGYLFVGRTSSYTESNADGWAVKLDSVGDVVWQQTYGGDSWDIPISRALTKTSDGGYLFGGHTRSFPVEGLIQSHEDQIRAWVVKLDSSGNEEWNRAYGTAERTNARSVIETRDNDYLFAGFTVPDRAEGEADGLVVKLDDSGEVIWDQTYHNSEWDWASSVMETDDGGYLFGGRTGNTETGDDWILNAWLVKVDAEGEKVWNQVFEENRKRILSVIGSKNSYLFAGDTESFDRFDRNTWFVKFSERDIEINININIKPGDGSNSINPNSRGVTPVAILSDDNFNAPEQVDVNTLRFGPPAVVNDNGGATAERNSVEDVDGDGDDDLVVHFTTNETEFSDGDETGKVVGETQNEIPLSGTDSVRIVNRGRRQNR